MSLVEDIKRLADELYPEVVSWREHLHENPELSFEEENTAKFIQKILSREGISFRSNVAGYGVVAEIIGQNPDSRLVALRADMDALPIQEENTVPYKSKVDGVMHACGHDVHTSSLLGAACILQRLRTHWTGTVRCIFQPAEEKLPGGASLMIKEGVLSDPTPSFILGCHVHPELEVGQIGLREGMAMASTDELYITINGKGGHGAMPHKAVDPIATAAVVISSAQQIVSRKAPATIPTVLSFGKINSDGGATNIIPDRVFIEGTFRTLNEEWRKEAHDWIQRTIQDICASFGATADVNIQHGYPFLENNPEVTRSVKTLAQEYYGQDETIEIPLRMTAEDFAFYSQVIPACFYRIGVANKSKGIDSAVHTSTFDIDPEALRQSTGFMAYAAIKAS